MQPKQRIVLKKIKKIDKKIRKRTKKYIRL